MVHSKCLLSAVPFTQDPVRKGQRPEDPLARATPWQHLEDSAKQRPKIFDCKANASRPAFWHAFLGSSATSMGCLQVVIELKLKQQANK